MSISLITNDTEHLFMWWLFVYLCCSIYSSPVPTALVFQSTVTEHHTQGDIRQKHVVTMFRRLEVQNQGAGRAMLPLKSSWEPFLTFSWILVFFWQSLVIHSLHYRYIMLILSPYGLFPVRPHVAAFVQGHRSYLIWVTLFQGDLL